MGRKLLGVVLACLGGLSFYAFAADLTSVLNTESNQLYNQSYRDVKDGTNGKTIDSVTANTYSFVLTTATIKATGGWLHAITVNATCAANAVFVLDDTTFSKATPTNISSFTATQGSYIFDTRFTALTIGVAGAATCPNGITVSYR